MTVFDDKGVLMVRMSPAEALRTIESLSCQIRCNNPNNERFEKFLDDDGRDFSISVSLPDKP